MSSKGLYEPARGPLPSLPGSAEGKEALEARVSSKGLYEPVRGPLPGSAERMEALEARVVSTKPMVYIDIQATEGEATHLTCAPPHQCPNKETPTNVHTPLYSVGLDEERGVRGGTHDSCSRGNLYKTTTHGVTRDARILM